MSCEDFRGLLQDYVTRELDPERRRQVDSHMMECGECQRELAALTALVSSLDHQPVLEPSPEFASRVLEHLPRQRSFYPNPWWAIALGPLLAGAAWLLRTPLLGGLAWLGRLVGIGPESLGQLRLPVPTTVTWAQMVIVPAVVIAVCLTAAVGAAAFGWRFVESD